MWPLWAKESHMFAMKFPRMLEHALMRVMDPKKRLPPRKEKVPKEPGE
jgi:hypothetical protein